MLAVGSTAHQLTLCISSSPDEIAQYGEQGKGVVVDFVVDDVDQVFAELSDKGVDFDEAPCDEPWGLRTSTLRDPAGSGLTITSYCRF